MIAQRSRIISAVQSVLEASSIYLVHRVGKSKGRLDERTEDNVYDSDINFTLRQLGVEWEPASRRGVGRRVARVTWELILEFPGVEVDVSDFEERMAADQAVTLPPVEGLEGGQLLIESAQHQYPVREGKTGTTVRYQMTFRPTQA